MGCSSSRHQDDWSDMFWVAGSAVWDPVDVTVQLVPRAAASRVPLYGGVQSTVTIALVGSGCSSSRVACVTGQAAFRVDRSTVMFTAGFADDDGSGTGTFCASLLTGQPPNLPDGVHGIRHSQCFHGGALLQWGVLSDSRLLVARVDDHPMSLLAAIRWSVKEGAQIVCVPSWSAVCTAAVCRDIQTFVSSAGVVLVVCPALAMDGAISVGGLDRGNRPLHAYTKQPTFYGPGQGVLGLARDQHIQQYRNMGKPHCDSVLEKVTGSAPAVMFVAAACASLVQQGVRPQDIREKPHDFIAGTVAYYAADAPCTSAI